MVGKKIVIGRKCLFKLWGESKANLAQNTLRAVVVVVVPDDN